MTVGGLPYYTQSQGGKKLVTMTLIRGGREKKIKVLLVIQRAGKGKESPLSFILRRPRRGRRGKRKRGAESEKEEEKEKDSISSEKGPCFPTNA